MRMAMDAKSLRFTRREFGRRAAIGAAAAALAPSQIVAKTSVADAIPAAGAAQDAKLSPDSQAEVDAKIAAIMRKYGSRLNDAQKADIRRLVTEGQKPLETMRAFRLDNSDQPANVMRIYPDSAAATRAAHLTAPGIAHETRKG